MIKNYTSSVPVSRILNNIQGILVKHGAQQVTFEYKDTVASGIAFSIKTPSGIQWVKLPARIEKVERLFSGTRYKDGQPQRTAWKNIHDWIDSQLALVETEMVKLEEVFLPYMTNNKGETFFETMEKNQFLLPEGKNA